MTGASVSDVGVKFCGKDFTLRASNEAYATVETWANMPYGAVLQRLQRDGQLYGSPRLTDVTMLFAAFALPHGKYSPEGIRALMPQDDGTAFVEAATAVRDAIMKASPAAKAEQAEAKGDGEIPQ